MKGFLVLLFLTIQLQNNYQNYGKIWKHFFFLYCIGFFPIFLWRTGYLFSEDMLTLESGIDVAP